MFTIGTGVSAFAGQLEAGRGMEFLFDIFCVRNLRKKICNPTPATGFNPAAQEWERGRKPMDRIECITLFVCHEALKRWPGRSNHHQGTFLLQLKIRSTDMAVSLRVKNHGAMWRPIEKNHPLKGPANARKEFYFFTKESIRK